MSDQRECETGTQEVSCRLEERVVVGALNGPEATRTITFEMELGVVFLAPHATGLENIFS